MTGNRMFSTEALENGIAKCKENIEVFDAAIQKERDTIKEYRDMIDKLQEKERHEKDFQSRIEVEIGG